MKESLAFYKIIEQDSRQPEAFRPIAMPSLRRSRGVTVGFFLAVARDHSYESGPHVCFRSYLSFCAVLVFRYELALEWIAMLRVTNRSSSVLLPVRYRGIFASDSNPVVKKGCMILQ